MCATVAKRSPLYPLYVVIAIFLILLLLTMGYWMNTGNPLKGPEKESSSANEVSRAPNNLTREREIQEQKKYAFISYLMDGKIIFDPKVLESRVHDYEAKGDILGLSTLYLMTRDKSLEATLKKSEGSPEALYALALCSDNSKDRLLYSNRLKLADPNDSLAKLINSANQFEGREPQVNPQVLMKTLRNVDFSKRFKLYEEKQSEIMSGLGQDPLQPCSSDFAGTSLLLDKMNMLIARFNNQDSGNSVEDSPEMRASASLAAISKFREAAGNANSFSAERKLLGAEIRTLENLNPNTEYGDKQTVGDRTKELGAHLDRLVRSQQAVSAALLQSSSHEIKSFGEQMRLYGMEAASEWLIGPVCDK